MMYVNPIVGRTGLCNMLFIWARALVFARKKNAVMLAPQWTNLFRLGPLIRFEKDKRYYINEFSNKGYVGGLKRFLINCIHRHVPEKYAENATDNDVVDFEGWSSTYFDDLLMHQGLIKDSLYAIINQSILNEASNYANVPFIGVHIRRGDFVGIGQSQSDEWYVRGVVKAREMAGDLPVKIFSDEGIDRLSGIVKNVPNSVVMPPSPAIQDLISLSYSQVLVGTDLSTFSMWAVFLGQMTSIWRDGKNVPSLYANNKKPMICTGVSNEAI